MKSLTGKELNVADNRQQTPKPMPDDEAQSKRFIEGAKLLEVDETGVAFERVMGVLAPPTATAKHDKK